MITWLLLVLLFYKSTQGESAHENGVLHCGPRSLTVDGYEQMMLLKWEDDPSCSAVHDTLIYELVVLVADKQEHYEELAVTPDQIGSTHLWNWTSPLAFECASHSVRLSSRYKEQKSPWKLEKTLPGANNSEVAVYPRDRVFKVGSTVTFCCILPAGTSLNTMYVDGDNDTNANTTKINNHTYALTVQLNQPSKYSCTNVYCITHSSSSGACAYIDYPPDDRDLLCETRDLEEAECHWTVGNNYIQKAYRLHGQYNNKSQSIRCEDGAKGRCSIRMLANVTEIKWSLTVENMLGKVELTDTADMTKRVHMVAPDKVTVSNINARNVSLEWEWSKPQYNKLRITCQLNVSYGGIYTISEKSGAGLHFAVLNDLIPNWKYNVSVRCRTAQHLWKWGDWSTTVSFHTKGDVPDALDVWMERRDNQVLITWKMLLANQTHGNITNYTVTWAKTTEPQQRSSITVAHSEHHVDLSLEPTQEYTVTVTARNMNGSSSPSTLTIPPHNLDRTMVNTSRITGRNGSFSLSWSASRKASCGYIVDWRPTLGNCSVEWLKVPPSETSSRIFSKNFRDGLRYTLSIYACTPGAPVLLERREGYVNEQRITDNLFELKLKQQDSDVEVTWDPVPLAKQSAFIRGYILYWSDNSNTVFNVNTAHPEATSLTARNLKITSYTFTLKAQTAVGECGTTVRMFTLNSLTDNLIKVVIICLVIFSSLFFLITVLCWRHWACVKQKVYPPIPKPVLMDKWLMSPDDYICQTLSVDQYHQSEANVSELHRKEASANVFVSQPCVLKQASRGYYNQPLKEKSTPPSHSLPTSAVPSHAESPLSSFTSVFPNLSYNLIIPTEHQQSDSEAKLQGGTSSERSFRGYQPQSHAETFTLNQMEENPESPISCVSTYILLPQ